MDGEIGQLMSELYPSRIGEMHTPACTLTIATGNMYGRSVDHNKGNYTQDACTEYHKGRQCL